MAEIVPNVKTGERRELIDLIGLNGIKGHVNSGGLLLQMIKEAKTGRAGGRYREQ